jgi:ribosomal 50S subunit-associated protein YjgA (DUF615 family)
MHTLTSTIPLTDQEIDLLAHSFNYDLYVPGAEISKLTFVGSVLKKQICDRITDVLSKSVIEQMEAQKEAALQTINSQVNDRITVEGDSQVISTGNDNQ